MSALTVVETDLACDRKKAREANVRQSPIARASFHAAVPPLRASRANREPNPPFTTQHRPPPESPRDKGDKDTETATNRVSRASRASLARALPPARRLRFKSFLSARSRRPSAVASPCARPASPRPVARDPIPSRASHRVPRRRVSARRVPASSRVARRLKNTHLDLGRLEGGDAADEGGSEKGRHCRNARVQECRSSDAIACEDSPAVGRRDRPRAALVLRASRTRCSVRSRAIARVNKYERRSNARSDRSRGVARAHTDHARRRASRRRARDRASRERDARRRASTRRREARRTRSSRPRASTRASRASARRRATRRETSRALGVTRARAATR